VVVSVGRQWDYCDTVATEYLPVQSRQRFCPLERQQTVQAPVSGRIVQWLAKEGTKVKAGDVLIEIANVNPELLERLGQQREAAAKLEAKEEELRSYRLANRQSHRHPRLQIATAQYRLDVAWQRGFRQRSHSVSTATLEAATNPDRAIATLAGRRSGVET